MGREKEKRVDSMTVHPPTRPHPQRFFFMKNRDKREKKNIHFSVSTSWAKKHPRGKN